MADISILDVNGQIYNLKDAAIREKIAILEETLPSGTGMTARQYDKTLYLSEWQEDGTYFLDMPELKCGDGSISPLIAPADSLEHEEYDKIGKAMAIAGEGITFTKFPDEEIEDDIDIIIIDMIFTEASEGINIPNGEEMEF